MTHHILWQYGHWILESQILRHLSVWQLGGYFPGKNVTRRGENSNDFHNYHSKRGLHSDM